MLKPLVWISGIVCLSISAFANAEAAKPHTVCWEAANERGGLEILLTDLAPTGPLVLTKVEIYQKHNSADKQLVGVKESNLVRQPSSELYRGDGISLEINLESTLETGERAAVLVIELEKGTSTSKALLCDSLQYSAGEVQASY